MSRRHSRITILADNLAGNNLVSEHGLAFWLEAEACSILFDTGAGDALFANAATLNIDPARAGLLVLSHGHYDHTGGIAELLRLHPGLPVQCHPGATAVRFSRHPDRPVKDISMPEAARTALQRNASTRHIVGPDRIAPGIWITGEIPRITPFEDTGGPFFLDPDGRTPDPIIDDLALWIETEAGLVIVLGCCHAGLVNTVEYIRRFSGIERIHGIIGGMHLLHASAERLNRTCGKLLEWNPAWIIPCHCTGEAAAAAMTARLGTRVEPGHAGMVRQIP